MINKIELPFEPAKFTKIISENVMQYHYDKHHSSYANNLNKLLQENNLAFNSAKEVLLNLDDIPQNIKQKVINNAGGVYNHDLFWQSIGKRTIMSNEFKEIITREFESVNNFYDQLKAASMSQFGSGWSWVVINEDNELEIYQTSNQNCPITIKKTPILAIDLWEHAYYLDYQNRRAEYVVDLFEIINWEFVELTYNYEMERRVA